MQTKQEIQTLTPLCSVSLFRAQFTLGHFKKAWTDAFSSGHRRVSHGFGIKGVNNYNKPKLKTTFLTQLLPFFSGINTRFSPPKNPPTASEPVVTEVAPPTPAPAPPAPPAPIPAAPEPNPPAPAAPTQPPPGKAGGILVMVFEKA